MVRLSIILEGDTEESFANQILRPHLAHRQVYLSARRVETSREKGKAGRKPAKIFRGGMTTYARAKKDLMRWMTQDQDQALHFTTMFDLYALPRDFPGFEAAATVADPYQRVAALEAAFSADVDQQRFIPYIQLHEFEALLLSRPEVFGDYYTPQRPQVAELVRLCAGVASPEMIDDDPQSAPSKRLSRLFSDFGRSKSTIGPLLAEWIGLPVIRAKCPHFDAWLTMLEALGAAATT